MKMLVMVVVAVVYKLNLRRVIDMTIDEVIALVKIERECAIRVDVCDRKCETCDLLQDSTKLTDMYKQLAEWLEELKALREEKSDFQIIAKDNYEMGMENGYNKAIDDFIHECRRAGSPDFCKSWEECPILRRIFFL